MSLAVAGGLVSCKSKEYYTEQAVEDARKFALENLRELTPLQRNFIRYNAPVLMSTTYMGRDFWAGIKPVGGNDFCQMCAVWEVPGEELPVIVFGPSDYGIRGWKPNRVIRRQFRIKELAREQAINNAMLYAMNNMLYLNTAERNRIRFSPPEILLTSFPLDIPGRNTVLQTAVKGFKNQVSFVWNGEDAGRKIVISGLSGENYAGFVTVTGLVRPDAEIKAHTRSVLVPARMATEEKVR